MHFAIFKKIIQYDFVSIIGTQGDQIARVKNQDWRGGKG